MWKETYEKENKHRNVKRDILMWKETFTHEKRPIYVKRGLCVWDLYMWEELSTYMTRDL